MTLHSSRRSFASRVLASGIADFRDGSPDHLERRDVGAAADDQFAAHHLEPHPAPRWRSERDRAAAAGGRAGGQDFAAWRGDAGCRSADWRADGGRQGQRRRAGDDVRLLRRRDSWWSMSAGRRRASPATPCQETVTVTAVNTAAKQITATFAYPTSPTRRSTRSAASARASCRRWLAGSRTARLPSVLKLYGDINGDGQHGVRRVHCDPAPGGTGNLYRNVMPYDQAPPKAGAERRSGAAQQHSNESRRDGMLHLHAESAAGRQLASTYVLDVAITLDREHAGDRSDHQSVPDRNQGAAERLAAQRVQRLAAGERGRQERVQPMPPSVTALLP